jgi:hypothetical protein
MKREWLRLRFLMHASVRSSTWSRCGRESKALGIEDCWNLYEKTVTNYQGHSKLQDRETDSRLLLLTP